MSFESDLNRYLKQVSALSVGMSAKNRAKITKAGAKVFQKELVAETKRKHFSNHKDKTFGHMADNIEMKSTNVDNQMDGTSLVGFDHYHAANARRINNGTKFYAADHFIDDVRHNSMDKVLAAEIAMYKKLVKQYGGD